MYYSKRPDKRIVHLCDIRLSFLKKDIPTKRRGWLRPNIRSKSFFDDVFRRGRIGRHLKINDAWCVNKTEIYRVVIRRSNENNNRTTVEKIFKSNFFYMLKVSKTTFHPFPPFAEFGPFLKS